MASTNNNKSTLSPGIVVRFAYFDKNHPSRQWMASTKMAHHDQVNAKFRDGNFVSHKDYSSRKTECIVDKQEWKVGYNAYQNQEHKVTSQGSFTRNFTYSSNEEFEHSLEYDSFKVLDKSLVWSGVISFSKEFFTEHQILDKETAADLTRDVMDDFFRNNGINPSSMQYAGQFHVDTPHHFHVHLQMHQVRPGCYDAKGKNPKWRTKGKFNQKSIKTLKEDIENYCLAKTARRNHFFNNVLQHRDAIKYSVLETLNNSQDMEQIVKLAYELKQMLPKQGRLQYNSGNLNALAKMKVDKLVEVLIEAGTTSSKEWKTFNQELDGKVEHYASEIDPNSKQGQMKLQVIEGVRKEKLQEVWSHVANQVIKAVKENDWHLPDNKYNLTVGKRQMTKKRNEFVKSFNSKKFWGQLASQSSNDIDKALQAIHNELQKNINEVSKNNERSQ